MKIEYSPIKSNKLFTFFEMIENNGIYSQYNTMEYLYVIQESYVFRWDHVKGFLESWKTGKIPDWISPNTKLFVRMPDDFKFSLTFSQPA